MFIGIDCSKEKHNYCIKNKEGIVVTRGIIYNSIRSVGQFIDKLKQFQAKSEETIMGIESTCNYHINLVSYLRKNDFNVVIINPLKTSAYNKIDNDGIKNDPIDAEGIADFLRDGKHNKIMPFNQKYLLLRELCRSWVKLKQDQTRIALRIYSRLIIVNPEFCKYFSNPLSPSGIYVLENYATAEELAIAEVENLQDELTKIGKRMGDKSKAKEIVELAKNSFGQKEDIEGYVEYIQSQLRIYKSYESEIRNLRKKIREESNREYCKHEIDLMSSIKGMSRELACGILSELGDVNNFSKRSAVWRFAGLITTSKESGTMVGKRKLTKKGSSFLRHYVNCASMMAKIHTKTFAAWYANKMLKVKDVDEQQKKVYKAKYRGALARRMLDTAFLCLKNNREFNDDIAFENLELADEIRELVKTQHKE